MEIDWMCLKCFWCARNWASSKMSLSRICWNSKAWTWRPARAYRWRKHLLINYKIVSWNSIGPGPYSLSYCSFWRISKITYSCLESGTTRWLPRIWYSSCWRSDYSSEWLISSWQCSLCWFWGRYAWLLISAIKYIYARWILSWKM